MIFNYHQQFETIKPISTEIAEAGVIDDASRLYSEMSTKQQFFKDMTRVHHDALEFANGKIVLLTSLCEGQEASVLQLPAQPTTQAEAEEQKRAEFAN